MSRRARLLMVALAYFTYLPAAGILVYGYMENQAGSLGFAGTLGIGLLALSGLAQYARLRSRVTTHTEPMLAAFWYLTFVGGTVIVLDLGLSARSVSFGTRLVVLVALIVSTAIISATLYLRNRRRATSGRG